MSFRGKGCGEACVVDPVSGDGGGRTKWNVPQHHLEGESQQDLEEIREETDNVQGFTINKNEELLLYNTKTFPSPQNGNSSKHL